MTMNLRTIQEGWIAQIDGSKVAVGPRCVALDNGDVVCTFMVQSAVGVNDLTPMQTISRDGGSTWEVARPVWPHLRDRFSLFCSVSRDFTGELFLYGIRFPIDAIGESFWSGATNGLKANDLFWARSSDGGNTWTEPTVIPMPIPGSAEAPGSLCAARSGRWLVCYAPYNTFDPALKVDRNQIVLLTSDDEGTTWRQRPFVRFVDEDSGGCEAWVVELAVGRLLGTCWQVGFTPGREFPNPFTISVDGGDTWTTARSTEIMGQSTALAPLPDGRALFVYNQRKHGDSGVWLAVSRPSEFDFGVEVNQIVWRAEQITRHNSSAEHLNWEEFAFGEPSVTVLKDETLLIALWCIQPSGLGIRYVRLRIDDL
jgi:hypothetical protein